MRRLLALLLLTACTDVHYGANIGIGPEGSTFSPSVSGSTGNAHFIMGM